MSLTRSDDPDSSPSQPENGILSDLGSSRVPQSSDDVDTRGGATTNEKLSVEEQLRKRNAYLQGRVDTLQEQNEELGKCITELRNFTDMVRTKINIKFCDHVYIVHWRDILNGGVFKNNRHV